MEKIDIRNYLYNGIQGINSINGDVYILESILKTGYIVNTEESKKTYSVPDNFSFSDGAFVLKEKSTKKI